ncbi:MAG: phytanoyl-CoA dioxygenase family protein [Flavobacteriales bacterium]
MAKQIFKSSEHQALFDRQGFIVLPFLNAQELQHLNAYFDEVHPHLVEDGFVSGSYSADFAYKKKASDEIVAVFERAYEQYFENYTPFGGAFLYKTPGKHSALAAHQDWTIVDEQTDVALNCWVPLCDITPENGPIMILPGSQFSKHPVLRAPTLPFFFSGHDELVLQELEPMLVPAGTAVILNQSVIHYSPSNTSQKIRKAITAGLKSAGAQMRFHYKVPGQDQLEVFEQQDDFLIRFDNFISDIGQRPKIGTSVGQIPYVLPQYDKEELRSLIAQLKTAAGYPLRSTVTSTSEPAQHSFLQRLKRLFK